jgi:prepilin-type N-terminal cleavage/methylation domain-containing protein
MKNISQKAFTLVELLVVITILAIISVVAYQNFGGAVDKANAGRKISDVSTIETSLAQYSVDNSYYPAVDEFNATTNRW